MENAGGYPRVDYGRSIRTRVTVPREVNVLQEDDFESLVVSKQISDLVDFCTKLHYLSYGPEGLRFIHLRLRDTLACHYIFPRLRQIWKTFDRDTWESLVSPAVALGAIDDKRVFSYLAQILEDRSLTPAIRGYAAGGFSRFRDTNAVNLLIEVLTHKDEDESVRSSICYSLASQGDLRATEALLVTLTQGKDEARQAAAYALGQLGDTRAIEPLCRAINDSSVEVAKEAISALGHFNDPLSLNTLMHIWITSNPLLVEAASFALANIGEAAAKLILRELITRFEDVDFRSRVIWTFSRMREEARKSLIALQNDRVLDQDIYDWVIGLLDYVDKAVAEQQARGGDQ
jgi:HEAT repeat protein